MLGDLFFLLVSASSSEAWGSELTSVNVRGKKLRAV